MRGCAPKEVPVGDIPSFRNKLPVARISADRGNRQLEEIAMTAFIEPITLSDRHAALEPLAYDHHDGLAEAVRDGDLWKLWYTAVPSPEGMRDEIERRLGLQRTGSMLPFAVRSRPAASSSA